MTDNKLIRSDVIEAYLECKVELSKPSPMFPQYIAANGARIPIEDFYSEVLDFVRSLPREPAAHLPCKIGDFVWAIRSFHGHKQPQRGIVSDMFFTKDMELQIVVKYVARGKWGETVFATDKEAYAAIGIHNCPTCGAKIDKGD